MSYGSRPKTSVRGLTMAGLYAMNVVGKTCYTQVAKRDLYKKFPLSQRTIAR